MKKVLIAIITIAILVITTIIPVFAVENPYDDENTVGMYPYQVVDVTYNSQTKNFQFDNSAQEQEYNSAWLEKWDASGFAYFTLGIYLNSEVQHLDDSVTTFRIQVYMWWNEGIGYMTTDWVTFNILRDQSGGMFEWSFDTYTQYDSMVDTGETMVLFPIASFGTGAEVIFSHLGAGDNIFHLYNNQQYAGTLYNGEREGNNAYQRGYEEGLQRGYQTGENNGYSIGYGRGHDTGYQEGYQAGLTAEEEQIYNTGYQVGYTQAQTDDRIKERMPELGGELAIAVAETPVNVLMSILDFEIFGINLFWTLAGIITILLVASVIKRFLL